MKYSLFYKKNIPALLFLMALLLRVVGADAQEQRTVISRADDAYIRYEYAAAARLYEHLIAQKKNKDNVALITKLADCYREVNEYESACKYYGVLTGLNGAPNESWLYYGDVLKSLGKYAEAKAAYNQYQQKTGTSASLQIAGCDSAVVWMAHPTAHKPENVQSINTACAEWGATWYGKNNQIVFVSDSLRNTQMRSPDYKVNKDIYGRTGRAYQKIYVVDTTDRGINVDYIHDFSPAMNGFEYHTGPVVFNKNYDSAYFTVTYFLKRDIAGEKLVKKGHTVMYGTRRLELWYSVKNTVTGQWGKAKPFAYNKPESYSVGQAALSNDGLVLYFVSNMPGGLGGLDLWYSERINDTTWGAPKNCGPSINTPFDESFPTIGVDGALYFSSKGKIGMGGYDIFRTEGSKQTWTIPRNMGSPINSPGDDFYYVTNDEQSGFFASNRQGGAGGDDVYKYTLASEVKITPRKPVTVLILDNTVFNAKDNKVMPGAAITLTNTNRNVDWRKISDANGKTFFVLEENSSYKITATFKDYTCDTVFFDSPTASGETDTVYTHLYLKERAYHVGESFVLDDLYYDFNKWDIRPDAAKILDGLVETLRKFPTMEIELSSHTDSRGSDSYNMALSEKRAKSAVDYLISRGIAANRVIAKGYGETRLVNGCSNGVTCTEEEHQLNRRTEVKVLKM
ncbi:OmpA family protein [Chitinophagaceae bacterium LWZ2-11]